MTGVQCSCCGLHGAVLIIISFRAYDLTSREFQVVNAPRRFGVPFKAASGPAVSGDGIVDLYADGDLE